MTHKVKVRLLGSTCLRTKTIAIDAENHYDAARRALRIAGPGAEIISNEMLQKRRANLPGKSINLNGIL